MTDRPFVSVLINTYNHARFIRAAVDSVFTQTEIDPASLEVIVVDDGSTDETNEILQSYGAKIRLVTKANGGQASAFNAGIPMCRGDVICLLDGDDWWNPLKIKKVCEAFAHDDTLVAVGHGIMLEDEVAGKSHPMHPATQLLLRHLSAEDVSIFRTNMCFLGTSRLSIRREVALSMLPVTDELVFEADEHFFTLLPAIGNVAILTDVLTHYRIHGANLYQDSRAVEGQTTHNLRRLKMRAQVFDALAKTLPDLLFKHNCAPEVIPLLVAPVANEARRLQLTLGNGGRIEAIRTEWREYRLRVSQGSGQMLAMAIARVICAGILPPKKFYELKQSYSASKLRAAVSWIDQKFRRKN